MLIRYGMGAAPRDAYTVWAEGVRSSGGIVTTLPHVAGNIPAARYPLLTVFPLAPDMTLAQGFARLPDDWTATGDYVYYAAPAAVSGYAASGMLQPQSVPGEPPPPNPKWYDDLLNSLKGLGKEVVIGVGVTVGVALILKSMRKR